MTVPTTPFGFGSTTTGPNDTLLFSLTALAAASLLFAFFVIPRGVGEAEGAPTGHEEP